MIMHRKRNYYNYKLIVQILVIKIEFYFQSVVVGGHRVAWGYERMNDLLIRGMTTTENRSPTHMLLIPDSAAQLISIATQLLWVSCPVSTRLSRLCWQFDNKLFSSNLH